MKTIQSVDKAIKILDYISTHNNQCTLTEISKGLDMVISTLSGFIYTLEQWRLIRKDPQTGRYQLGIHTYQLGTMCDIQSNLRETLRPYIIALSDQIDETIHLAIPIEKTDIVYIDKAECKRPFRMTSIVGAVEPMLQSALGVIIADALGSPPLDDAAKATIYSHDGKKYCKRFEPHMDAFCIAVALFNHYNQPIGAISAVVSVHRLSISTEEYILASMFSTAESIKKLL